MCEPVECDAEKVGEDLNLDSRGCVGAAIPIPDDEKNRDS